METDGNSEFITISKPDDWSQADWDALTPRQKTMYFTNPSLYRPGQSGREGTDKRPPGRPRKDGLPAGSLVGVPQPPATGEGGKPPTVGEPSFETTEAQTIKESLEVNGAALVNDAYRRAARAATSGDPFDRAVYLTLLGKAHPMATLATAGKALSGDAKRRKRALEALLAAHTVQDASFTPVKPADQAQGFGP